MIKMTLLKILFFVIISGFLLIGETHAQQTQNPLVKRNSPYSPNPKKKVELTTQKQPTAEVKNIPNNEKVVDAETANKSVDVNKSANAGVSNSENNVQPKTEDVNFQNAEFESRSIAKKTFDVAK